MGVAPVSGAAVLAWAVLLVGSDVCFHRLPDWLTVPATPLIITLVLVTYPATLPQRLVGGAVWCGTYLVVWAVTAGIGGGDIKLSFPLGLLAGFPGALPAMAIAALATVVAAAVVVRRARVPHGPAMVAATFLVVSLQLSP